MRLTFHARKGRLVELADWEEWPSHPCVRKSLRTSTGKKLANWATGYWRLPRTGSYTAVLRPCGAVDDVIHVQVRKVVVQDAVVDGGATAVGADPDVTHLVGATVTADQPPLAVDVSRTPRHIVRPDGRLTEGLPYGRLTFDPTGTTAWSGGPGRYYVAARPDTTVTVTRTLRQQSMLDGAEVVLDNQGVGSRRHEVVFTGRAGQWVYPQLQDTTGALVNDGQRNVGLIGPTGGSVNDRVMTSCPGKATSEQCSYRSAAPRRRTCSRCGSGPQPLPSH
ncbi:hypothetical protein J2X46_002203 [Nocardioides sp. BE266]|uniref:hypothetical protein n=1 Tax=Nocardioides sp. BE266 TaxID=2817725 RepID=UPI0028590D36|nr:hypothetical protein [Nocardioides sp. BE266]MDR7253218.1 hypothetical protein [Nocardioides sp. BE266]